jgi:hypothetical protein
MRSKISPTFTSGKMKNMFPLLEECAKNFEICLQENQGVDLQIKVIILAITKLVQKKMSWRIFNLKGLHGTLHY